MKRSVGPIVTALAIVALLASAVVVVLGDRATPEQVELAGRVTDEQRDVVVPLLRSDAPTGTATPGQPTVAGRIATVAVAVGDHVDAGDPIATLDQTALLSAHDLALAQAREARASVALLEEKADDVHDTRSDLAAKRRELADLLADLRDKRADVRANLTRAREMLKSLPGTMPTASVPPSQPPGAPAGVDPRAAVAQMEAALAQLDAGIAKAEAGLSRLDDARATLADARVVLDDLRVAASHAADAADAGAKVAEARLALATVRAPVAGTITQAPAAGAVAYAGAPLARIRPDGDVVVEAYVSAEDAPLLAKGRGVRVSADYLDTPLAGEVIDVAATYAYPPTSQATDDIHMVRAVRVKVRVDTATLPAGAPVDIIVMTGQ